MLSVCQNCFVAFLRQNYQVFLDFLCQIMFKNLKYGKKFAKKYSKKFKTLFRQIKTVWVNFRIIKKNFLSSKILWWQRKCENKFSSNSKIIYNIKSRDRSYTKAKSKVRKSIILIINVCNYRVDIILTKYFFVEKIARKICFSHVVISRFS